MCSYPMKKHVVLKKRFPSGQTGDIEDDHMVKFYPIVCSLHLKKLQNWRDGSLYIYL